MSLVARIEALQLRCTDALRFPMAAVAKLPALVRELLDVMRELAEEVERSRGK